MPRTLTAFAVLGVLWLLAPPLGAKPPPTRPGNELRLDVAFLYGGETAKRLMAAYGRHNRSFGAALRMAWGQGELTAYTEPVTFTLEIQNPVTDRLIGTTVRYTKRQADGSLAHTSEAAGETSFTIDAAGGSGWIEFNTSAWIHPAHTVIIVHPPADLELIYPPRPYRAIYTCTGLAIASGRCGRWSEYFKAMRSLFETALADCKARDIANHACGRIPRDADPDVVEWMLRYVSAPSLQTCVGRDIAAGKCGYLSELYLASLVQKRTARVIFVVK